MTSLWENPPKNLFFTGKGGVGKTTTSAAVRIQETLRQIQKQAPEIQVQRYGLSTAPQAFVANASVAEVLKSEEPECLPLAYVDGVLVCKGRYPTDEQIQQAAKLAGFDLVLGEKKKSSFGCKSGCC